MGTEDFLSLDLEHAPDGINAYGGLLEEWRHRSNRLRAPITYVVFEQNGAQKWFLQQPLVQRWVQATGIPVVGHTTHTNKADPKFGLESIGDLFRQGKIRLPDANPTSRLKVDFLLKEVKAYSGVRDDTIDLLMSTWFGKLAVENHYTPQRVSHYDLGTPRWLSGYQRGLDGYRPAQPVLQP